METFIMFKDLIGKNVYAPDWMVMNMMQSRYEAAAAAALEPFWGCRRVAGTSTSRLGATGVPQAVFPAAAGWFE